MELFGEPTLDLMDSLVEKGKVKEMIVVQPDARHCYGGCQYANSPVSGNWADFITKEVVAYIDKNFRTLPKAESRGLIGWSMGGRGVLDLALKFPGVYGVVYAMYPGQMGFRRFPRQGDQENWRKLIISNDPDTDNMFLQRLLGFAVAFSPNPNAPPYFADFPMMLDGEVMRINEPVMRRWSQFDPVEIAENDASPLSKLNALYFDCGTSDSGLKAARLFASILTKQNIPHDFQEYEGSHGDPGAVRLSSRVLPVVSKNLAPE
jgi:S-formylglutathione hydrolase FrmB